MAMTKNRYTSGIMEDLAKEASGGITSNIKSGTTMIPGATRAAGRPRVHEDPYERTSITLPSELMGKLRMFCLEERKQLRDVIEEALNKYFIEIEKERGTISIPETYRNK